MYNHVRKVFNDILFSQDITFGLENLEENNNERKKY